MVETRSIIQNGSKSFYFASLFFDQRTQSSCWDLYQWCRYCDDVIDNANLNTSAQRNLEILRTEWGKIANNESASPQFEVVKNLKSKFQIPDVYFLDLLKGFEMDVEGQRFDSIDDLERYCYHVAGVVGVKMSFIMGVSDTKALKHAVDLGKAMQLTNIARDVKEDFHAGRIYLPLAWLNEAGISGENFSAPGSLDKKYEVVKRILSHADCLYKSGYEGLKYLPLRAAFTVSIAGSIYSYIGKKIQTKGPESLNQRTVVSTAEKIICAIKGVVRVLPIAFKRIGNPWTPVSIAQKEWI